MAIDTATGSESLTFGAFYDTADAVLGSSGVYEVDGETHTCIAAEVTAWTLRTG